MRPAVPPRPSWSGGDLAAVALGGALGATGRHVLAGALPADPLAVGVVVANLLGATALGAATVLPMRRRTGLFWRTGVLGAFTTFSGLALQAVDLGPVVGPAYATGLVAVGVAVAVVGAAVGARVRARTSWSPGGPAGG